MRAAILSKEVATSPMFDPDPNSMLDSNSNEVISAEKLAPYPDMNH